MQQLKLLSDQILTDWEGIKLQKSVLVPMIWYEFSKEFFFQMNALSAGVIYYSWILYFPFNPIVNTWLDTKDYFW